MVPPKTPPDEIQRFEALNNPKIFDSPLEERFDRITRMAARIYDVPIAVLTLVDDTRQSLKSYYGLTINETTCEIPFCGHTILSDKCFIVPDALLDPRFSDNPLVIHEPFIRFYAGISLRTKEGWKIGTLAIIDRQPRNIREKELLFLADLARIAEAELNSAALSGVTRNTLRESEERYRTIFQTAAIGITNLDPDGLFLHA